MANQLRLARIIDDHLVLNRIPRTEFAKQLGMSPSSATRWFNGRGEVNGENLAGILRWLLEPIDAAAKDAPEDTEEDAPGDARDHSLVYMSNDTAENTAKDPSIATFYTSDPKMHTNIIGDAQEDTPEDAGGYEIPF